jgi:hypothetical protein
MNSTSGGLREGVSHMWQFNAVWGWTGWTFMSVQATITKVSHFSPYLIYSVNSIHSSMYIY